MKQKKMFDTIFYLIRSKFHRSHVSVNLRVGTNFQLFEAASHILASSLADEIQSELNNWLCIASYIFQKDLICTLAFFWELSWRWSTQSPKRQPNIAP